jgi:two-component system response regulator ChvI
MPPERESDVRRIALVDDDDLFRDTLAASLRMEGFEVAMFPGGRAALEGLIDRQAWRELDVVVLDWRMPEIDGPEVLRRMRQAEIAVPVVMLTSLGDQIYEEAALSSGATDFVEKDRSISILAQRLRLAGRKLQASQAEDKDKGGGIETFGDLTLDLDAHRASWKGREVGLTVTEFQMVALMARRQGRDVTYRELYDLVHGGGFHAGSDGEGYRSNVRGFIKRIRRKFSDGDPEFRAIENYAGFGYRWRQPDDA